MDDCPKFDCKYRDKSCFLCVDFSHYIPKKPRQRLQSRVKKDGIDFEIEIAKKYNEMKLGHRVLGSGALPGLKGDVKLGDMLAECKTRGTINASGEKTISLTKAMFEKIKKEAGYEKIPILPFKYKNDDVHYVAMEFDILLYLVEEIERLEALVQEND